MNLRLFSFLAALVGFVAQSWALCPHEVLVLANENSIDSVLVAKTFVRLRGIPDSNLIRLPLPESITTNTTALSTNDFHSLIWEPAQNEIRKRGLNRHILAWVYSTDFPYRIQTQPELSLTGLTFLRGRVPEDLVHTLGNPVGEEKFDPRLTLYASPLFAGPEESETPSTPLSKTFDQARVALLEDMPLPAMVLGWTGTRGNTLEEVVDCLKRGAASDASFPDASFCVATNSDIRSTAREWEFSASQQDLAALGKDLAITPDFPATGSYAGFLTGRVTLPESTMELLPGAYADHFTSYAAAFHVAHQSKQSEWIRCGATATSGTVTEPYAYWQKFANSSLFLHQVRGCSMVEAIYQSVRCPLQLLPVGDPLARPWGRTLSVKLEGLPSGALSKPVTVFASAEDVSFPVRVEWLVDGRIVGSGASWSLDPAAFSLGKHTLRAVIRGPGPIRENGFAEKKFSVEIPSMVFCK